MYNIVNVVLIIVVLLIVVLVIVVLVIVVLAIVVLLIGVLVIVVLLIVVLVIVVLIIVVSLVVGAVRYNHLYSPSSWAWRWWMRREPLERRLSLAFDNTCDDNEDYAMTSGKR